MDGPDSNPALRPVREWVFKWRGTLLIPAGLSVYLLGHPTLTSFLLGSVVALLGEFLRIWGVGYTGVTTREDHGVAPRLTSAGPYAYVRNPLYTGNCITAFGFYLAACGGASWTVRIGLLVALAILYGTVYGLIIPLEEQYLARTFGDTFRTYCQNVPRLFPSFRPYPNPEGIFDWQVIPRAEVHTLGLLVAVAVLFYLKLHGWS